MEPVTPCDEPLSSTRYSFASSASDCEVLESNAAKLGGGAVIMVKASAVVAVTFVKTFLSRSSRSSSSRWCDDAELDFEKDDITNATPALLVFFPPRRRAATTPRAEEEAQPPFAIDSIVVAF
jgi:hypothetical protein